MEGGGCDSCPSSVNCRALWDSWIEQDGGAHLGRLMNRLGSLERLPGWRLPPGEVWDRLKMLEASGELRQVVFTRRRRDFVRV